jgi:O-antigen/teichoic acid export membrane protein
LGVNLSIKQKIFEDASFYSVSIYILVLFSTIKGFFVRAILGPTTYGLFTIFQIILNYAAYSHLGILFAIEREIPYFIGKREFEKVENIKNTSFTFIQSFLSLGIIIVFLLTFILVKKAPLFIQGFRIVLLIVFAQQLYIYYVTLLRSEKKFNIVSKVTIIFAVFSTLLCILLGLKYKLTGVLWALVISYLIAIIYINMKRKYGIRFKIDKKLLRELIKTGFVLLIIGLGYITLTSIDKIVIIIFLDKTSLGYYSIAFMVVTLMMYFPNAISSIMFPSFLGKYGENDNIQDLKKYMVQPTLILAYLMPILIGWIYIIIGPLIKLTLNKYIPGIESAKILVLGSFFLAVVYMAGHLLVTLKKFNKYIRIQILVIGMAILLNIVFVRLGWGIKGVAYATSIGFFLYSSAIIHYAFRQYSNQIKDFLKYIGGIYLPFIYMLGILFFLRALSRVLVGFDEWILTLIEVIIFSIFSIPLIFLVNKKTGIIHIFLDTFRKK